MPQVVVRWPDSAGALQTAGLDGLTAARAAAWCWVDVTAPDAATMASLAEEFGLHDLAVEDTLHKQVRPKFDTYGDSAFLVWMTAVHPDGDGVIAQELDVFLGTGYLITAHPDEVSQVSETAADLARSTRSGPDWVLHSVIDRLVDGVLPIVDEMGDQLDSIEDAMLGEPRKVDLERLYRVRRQLVHMHRIVAPERDILRGLARERDVVSEEAYRYFQDVGDHLARVEDSIETYRDVGAGVMDIYLSAQSNRMNEIMKQLTVVATIFMPLTLISGIYGMNVLGPDSGTPGMWPPPRAAWSFAVVVGSMVAIAVWMSWYFRRKNWW